MDSRADALSTTQSQQVAAELKALLDAAVDGVIVIDHEGRITTFNASAERLFGYSSAEIIGQRINALMPEPYRAGHDGYMHSYQQTGKARIIGIGREVAAQRRDGTVFPAALAVGEVPAQTPGASSASSTTSLRARRRPTPCAASATAPRATSTSRR